MVPTVGFWPLPMYLTYAVLGTLALSGLITVRSDNIWPLVLRIACLVSLYWVTERVSRESQRWWSSTVHVVCQREMVISLLSVTPAISGIYHRHCMDIPSEVFDEDSEVHWECNRWVQSHTQATTIGKSVQSESIL